MDIAPKITATESDTKGQLIARLDSHSETAELTYSIASATLIIVDHTAVPDSLRGTGMGLKLAEAMVERARTAGQKIIPLCPFFKAQALKHPDWQDVVNL